MTKSHNFIIHGRRTAMRLEPEFLSALADICHRENTTAKMFIESLSGRNLSSQLRCAILAYYMNAAALPKVDLRGEPL